MAADLVFLLVGVVPIVVATLRAGLPGVTSPRVARV
jgi:hypothetical protein